MNLICYHSITGKLINGSLFYCFEYFVFCNKFKETDFLIYNCSECDLNKIKNIFKDRYNFDYNLLDKIKILKNKTDLVKINHHKVLFLDVNSFNSLYFFIKNTKKEILCYSNDFHNNIRSSNNNIIYYGYYNYQVFDKKTKLKFNFEIYKPLNNIVTNTALITSSMDDQIDLVNKMEIKEKNIIFKTHNKSISNLFNSFDTLYYFHTGFDKNNRLIPESFFYCKNVILYDNGSNDSVKQRYNDILLNGISEYELSEKDILIKDFLS